MDTPAAPAAPAPCAICNAHRHQRATVTPVAIRKPRAQRPEHASGR